MTEPPETPRAPGPPELTAAPCRTYLVRHGRTVLNAQGRFRGTVDPPLDELGRVEARRAAERLKGTHLDGVYSSPLLRARETAGAIASVQGIPFQRVPGLRDLDYGLWSGHTPEEVNRSDPSEYRLYRAAPVSATPPGGESVAALSVRVQSALHRISLDHEGGRIAVVTHELPIRLVLALATGEHGSAIWRFVVPTGSVQAVIVRRDGIELPGDSPHVLRE